MYMRWQFILNIKSNRLRLHQISLVPQNFSLHFNQTRSEDTGEYNCIVNDRHSPEEIIDLLVQGKRYCAFIIRLYRNKNDLIC